MKFKLFILMSLTVLLSSSSFFLADHIESLIDSDRATASQIRYASKIGLPPALKHQLSTVEIGSRKWQYYMSKLAEKDGQFAFKLTDFYHHQDDIITALTWAKRAIKLGNYEARLYVARYHYSQADYILVKETLSTIADQHEALMLLVEVAIIQGDTHLFHHKLASYMILKKAKNFYRCFIDIKFLNRLQQVS